MSNRQVVSPNGTALRGPRAAAGDDRRPLLRADRAGRDQDVRQQHAQDVGAGLCSTNTGGTSAPGWYFMTVAKSAPRMSPLEW